MTSLHQAEIVASARSYIGTRFAHQGRRKASGADKGGVDCLGLLIGVARECGLRKAGMLLADLDERDYGHIPDGARLRAALAKHLHEVEAAEVGDVLLCDIDGNAQHVAIAGDYAAGGLSLIHAYAPARAVVEHRLDAAWHKRICGVFRYQLSVISYQLSVFSSKPDD